MDQGTPPRHPSLSKSSQLASEQATEYPPLGTDSSAEAFVFPFRSLPALSLSSPSLRFPFYSFSLFGPRHPQEIVVAEISPVLPPVRARGRNKEGEEAQKLASALALLLFSYLLREASAGRHCRRSGAFFTSLIDTFDRWLLGDARRVVGGGEGMSCGRS